MNANITVSRVNGALFCSDSGSRAKQITMRICEREEKFVSCYSPYTTTPCNTLDVGNFGWNICAIRRVPFAGYKTQNTMRTAITRMMRNRGYNIDKWEWED